MAAGHAKLAFVLVFAINCVLWSQSRYAQVPGAQPRPSLLGLVSRASLDGEYADLLKKDKVCAALCCTFARD
jgi:hypothetical protein